MCAIYFTKDYLRLIIYSGDERGPSPLQRSHHWTAGIHCQSGSHKLLASASFRHSLVSQHRFLPSCSSHSVNPIGICGGQQLFLKQTEPEPKQSPTSASWVSELQAFVTGYSQSSHLLTQVRLQMLELLWRPPSLPLFPKWR